MVAEVRGGEPQTLGDKQPPKILERVMPVYPTEAKDQKIQGRVILEAVINEKGEVVEIKELTDKEKLQANKVTEPPHPSLVKAAMEAVKQWKYEPYKDPATGKVLPVRFSVELKFELK